MHDLTPRALTLQWLAIAPPKGLRRQCNIVVSPDPSTSQGTIVIICPCKLSPGMPLKSIDANFVGSMEANTTNFFWGFHAILSSRQRNLTSTAVTMGERLDSRKPAGKSSWILMWKYTSTNMPTITALGARVHANGCLYYQVTSSVSCKQSRSFDELFSNRLQLGLHYRYLLEEGRCFARQKRVLGIA
jgi:hypothetical protein